MRTVEFRPSFDAETFKRNMDLLNDLFLNGLTLSGNFSGQILADIKLPAAGTEVAIAHKLNVAPKYRIILRQKGLVLDGDTPWNERNIYLKSGSGADELVTVLLLRG